MKNVKVLIVEVMGITEDVIDNSYFVSVVLDDKNVKSLTDMLAVNFVENQIGNIFEIDGIAKAIDTDNSKDSMLNPEIVEYVYVDEETEECVNFVLDEYDGKFVEQIKTAKDALDIRLEVYKECVSLIVFNKNGKFEKTIDTIDLMKILN